MHGRGALIGFCILACAAAALGQEPQLNLADIRKNNFPTIDRQRVQDWCQQRVKQLLASKEPMKDGAGVRRPRSTSTFRRADATAAFKTGMIEVIAAAFAAQYKPAHRQPESGRPSLGAVILLAFIRST